MRFKKLDKLTERFLTRVPLVRDGSNAAVFGQYHFNEILWSGTRHQRIVGDIGKLQDENSPRKSFFEHNDARLMNLQQCRLHAAPTARLGRRFATIPFTSAGRPPFTNGVSTDPITVRREWRGVCHESVTSISRSGSCAAAEVFANECSDRSEPHDSVYYLSNRPSRITTCRGAQRPSANDSKILFLKLQIE